MATTDTIPMPAHRTATTAPLGLAMDSSLVPAPGSAAATATAVMAIAPATMGAQVTAMAIEEGVTAIVVAASMTTVDSTVVKDSAVTVDPVAVKASTVVKVFA